MAKKKKKKNYTGYKKQVRENIVLKEKMELMQQSFLITTKLMVGKLVKTQ